MVTLAGSTRVTVVVAPGERPTTPSSTKPAGKLNPAGGGVLPREGSATVCTPTRSPADVVRVTSVPVTALGRVLVVVAAAAALTTRAGENSEVLPALSVAVAVRN